MATVHLHGKAPVPGSAPLVSPETGLESNVGVAEGDAPRGVHAPFCPESPPKAIGPLERAGVRR